jgi:DHA1 family inner membrane transport protein
MIIYVLMLCSFAVATAEFVLVGLLPEISAGLSVTLPTAGALVTVYMLVVTVGGPLAAVATRRVPRRGLLVATMALALASALASALAGTYPVLLAARVGSALAQALFMAVASQVAMASAAPERRTAAVARVFNGFALATVLGLPLGTLLGHAYGWHATFALVAALCAAGLAGVALFAPPVAAPDAGDLRESVAGVLRPAVLRGLAVVLLAFTGFVAAFTYVAPALRTVTGLGPTGVGLALVGYGLSTLAGNWLAGRVPPAAITRVLPVALAVLAGGLAVQGIALRHPASALAALAALGASAFVVVPLAQTWLMGRAGPAAATLTAAVNISVAGLAAALGAALGGGVLSAGYGLAAIGPVAAVPAALAVATALGLRERCPDPVRSAA